MKKAPRSAPAPAPVPVTAPTRERRLGERLFEIAPDIYRIPLPTDFAVGDVNVYLIDGPDPVLIDTGVAGRRTLSVIADAFELLGRRVSNLSALLLTHVHVDHAGCARALRDLAGCPVYPHPRGQRRLHEAEGEH